MEQSQNMKIRIFSKKIIGPYLYKKYTSSIYCSNNTISSLCGGINPYYRIKHFYRNISNVHHVHRQRLFRVNHTQSHNTSERLYNPYSHAQTSRSFRTLSMSC